MPYRDTCRTNPKSIAFRIPESVTFDPGERPSAVAVGGTKMERAEALFNKYPNASRQFIMQQFQRHLSMTKAGASTYYTMLKAQKDYK